ncbi:MAG: hypothetical protein ABEJ30_08995 [Halorientalis sp.]
MSADESGYDDDRNWKRLVLLLLFLLLVVVAGSGLTAFVGDEGGNETTPTVTLTPVGPGGGGDGPGTPTPTATSAGGDGPERTPVTTATRPRPVPDEGAAGGGGGGASIPTATGSVDLRTVGSAVLFDYLNVAPGDGGRERLVLRNAGDRTGRLVAANVTVTDAENGIVGPEADVDDSPDAGELSRAVEVTVRVRYPDGTTAFLYGTGDGPRTLAAVADAGASAGRDLGPEEEATVVVDWSIPATTDNEIQSDELEARLVFALRAR